MGKIGLVLSGGVAKGAYEVGVIKALAERRIVPDVIVGISAGALNGASMAGMITSNEYDAKTVQERLAETWVEKVSLSNFYHAFDGDDAHSDLDRKSLNNLLVRLGIDPFSKSYVPTKFDPNVLRTIEHITKLDFVSVFSHAFMRQVAMDFQFPHHVERGVKFSAVICNLMGSTSLNENQESIENRWTHYEDFHWYPNMPRAENFIQFSRLIDVIMGSSSFPLVFPPMRLTPTGATKSGLFIDGGMTDCAPIGKAIAMDAEIDTVFVVMATTVVAPLDQEVENIFQVFSRMSEMAAGKFIISNYHKVLKVNRRIEAMARVLERDADGDYRDSEFNEQLCVAAGFGGLADFRNRRVVRIIPIFPSTPLKGDLFAGFLDKKLARDYVEIGYQDGRETIQKRFLDDDGRDGRFGEDAFPQLAT